MPTVSMQCVTAENKNAIKTAFQMDLRAKPYIFHFSLIKIAKKNLFYRKAHFSINTIAFIMF